MTTPQRVTGPTSAPVTLEEVKAYCRIDGDDSNAILNGLIEAAVAHFDGYRGVLRRCIMSQVWKVDMPKGVSRFPLPDVSEPKAENAESEAVSVDLSHDALGSLATLSEAATVTFTTALPDEALPAVKNAMLMWVRMRYDGLTGPEAASYQAAIDGQIAPLRWTQV